jgi:cyclopropane-fatty-acyl-phospholipid synthase
VNPTLARIAGSQLLNRIHVGSLVISEPGGRRHRFGSGPPEATLNFHADRAWCSLLGGSLGLADAYADGLWDSPDLVAVVRLAARNMPVLDGWRRRFAPIVRPTELVRTVRRPRDRAQSRRDIAAHYDLGNDLFSRMLDATMTYSCAIFDGPDATLEEAQRAKLERVCEKLELDVDQRVLEIGSGWGSFALHAAGTRGCRVTTTTISREQYEYVVGQVQRAGLTDLLAATTASSVSR